MSKTLSVRLFFVLLLSGIIIFLPGCAKSENSGEEPPVYSPARVLTPEAPGTQTLGSSPLVLDISNQDQGYLTAQSDSEDSRMSIQLTTPSGVLYSNFLAPKEQAVIPFSEGSGDYVITCYQQINGSQYAALYSETLTVNLENEFLPFLYPNQYVNFSAESEACTLAQSLVTEEMKDVDPQMYEVLVRQNIHSLVVVPLYDDGKVIGFYGVDNPSTRYFEFVSEMLQIMGHFIVSSLKQRNLVRELEVMSYSDPLTTLGNRYAMERYIEQVDHTEPIGVVYCDITGLKRINDSEGHSAGDRLIRRCCDCLKRVFEGNGMFRIGGDELVVLCTGISEKEFYQKVEELKTELAAHDVSMAVGAAVNTLEAVGKDHLLTESERRMYQDKAEYYRSTGLDRRKI